MLLLEWLRNAVQPPGSMTPGLTAKSMTSPFAFSMAGHHSFAHFAM